MQHQCLAPRCENLKPRRNQTWEEMKFIQPWGLAGMKVMINYAKEKIDISKNLCEWLTSKGFPQAQEAAVTMAPSMMKEQQIVEAPKLPNFAPNENSRQSALVSPPTEKQLDPTRKFSLSLNERETDSKKKQQFEGLMRVITTFLKGHNFTV